MRMKLPTMWLGIAGAAIMVLMMAKRVKGAIMFGILFTTFISWIPDHAASYLGPSSQIPGGSNKHGMGYQVLYTCICKPPQLKK